MLTTTTTWGPPFVFGTVFICAACCFTCVCAVYGITIAFTFDLNYALVFFQKKKVKKNVLSRYMSLKFKNRVCINYTNNNPLLTLLTCNAAIRYMNRNITMPVLKL